MKLGLAALVLSCAAGAAHAGCAGDALVRAEPLLRLHFARGGEGVPDLAISDVVKTLPAIKAPVGRGRFDVLEVRGYIYKSEYRMRFIYAQIPNDCVLMGQEIIELSDPY